MVPCGLGLLFRFYGCVDFCAMTLDDGFQFLLDLTKYARRIDAREIAVDVFVHNLDQGEYLG